MRLSYHRTLHVTSVTGRGFKTLLLRVPLYVCIWTCVRVYLYIRVQKHEEHLLFSIIFHFEMEIIDVKSLVFCLKSRYLNRPIHKIVSFHRWIVDIAIQRDRIIPVYNLISQFHNFAISQFRNFVAYTKIRETARTNEKKRSGETYCRSELEKNENIRVHFKNIPWQERTSLYHRSDSIFGIRALRGAIFDTLYLNAFGSGKR